MVSTKDLNSPQKSPRILVVDDDPNFLLGISTALTRLGFTVITASTSKNAILKAQSENPDLIILDINMPKPNGLEVKKILNSNPRTQFIPTIFLTALDDRNIRLCSLSIADDYITKPCDLELLTLRMWAIFRTMEMGFELGTQVSKHPSKSEIPHGGAWSQVDIKV
jgi:DNA-binding response OmpR family regulator